MERENMYIIAEPNSYLKDIGTFSSVSMSVEEIQKMEEFNKQAFEDLISKINDEYKEPISVQELTDLEFISSGALTDNLNMYLSVLPKMRQDLESLRKLDISVDNITMHQLGSTTSRVSKALPLVLEDIIDWVISQNDKENPVESVNYHNLLLSACIDLCRNKMSMDLYNAMNNLGLTDEQLESGEYPVEVSEGYEAWIREEAIRLTALCITYTDTSFFIYPNGVREFKDKIKAVLPTELDSFVEKSAIEHIIYGKYMSVIRDAVSVLPTEQKQEIGKAVDSAIKEFINLNSAGTIPAGVNPTQDPNTPPEEMPILAGVNIQELILHAVILAGFNIATEEEFEQDKFHDIELLADIIRRFLEEENISYGKYTPYRLLALVSDALPLVIMRNTILRVQDHKIMHALNVIGSIFYNKTEEAKLDEAKEELDQLQGE